MQGHVRKRGRKWCVVVDIGRVPKTDDDGRPVLGADDKPIMVRKQRWYSGYDRKQDAEDALPDILKQGKTGAPRRRVRNVAEFLTDVWLPAVKVRLRPATYDSYRRTIERRVVPRIGGIRLRQLAGDDLNRMYADLLERGGRNEQGLSPRTVRYVHAIVRKALQDAVRWNLVHRNVGEQADPPAQRRNRDAIKTWTKEQLKAFLAHVADDRLYALWHLLASTGMRRGEALGLAWEALDLDAGRVTIRRALVTVGYETQFAETKTDRWRTVELDARTVEVLREHAQRQAAEIEAAGDTYGDPEHPQLVFCTEDGEPLHPDRVSKVFTAHVKSSALPRIRLHDLRHTHATLALAAGVHPKVVQERLGHASITITLDTYTHASPAIDAAAAEQIAALIA